MCGIVAIVHRDNVNQLIYDALLLLQHRGQDAAGIATQMERKFFMYKAKGMVRDVFRTRNMRALPGNCGVGQVRYPTAGNSNKEEEAQPFYVNAPFGIVMVHNGNLTNTQQLRDELAQTDHRHINTDSDSEVLLNVLANELAQATQGFQPTTQDMFNAVRSVHKRVKGAYAVIAMIAGYGLLAFRDPCGIRPLCIGKSDNGVTMLASESVAMEGLGIELQRDVAPGEAVFIDLKGRIHTEICIDTPQLNPCLFEYVYLSRPDSELDDISVYRARLKMGEILAKRVISTIPPDQIDAVIPIPESSRPSAMQLAHKLGLPYREGFVKNRYVGRTFIMPGQSVRKKSVRQKLNVVKSEFQNKNVLLVDDSIVRGTTSREIVQMARDAGAKKVFLASAAPPVRFANVYGIDMPNQTELVAHERSVDEIRALIGCNELIYQDLETLKKAIQSLNPNITKFDASCFDGVYVTGDITEQDIERMQQERCKAQTATEEDEAY